MIVEYGHQNPIGGDFYMMWLIALTLIGGALLLVAFTRGK